MREQHRLISKPATPTVVNASEHTGVKSFVRAFYEAHPTFVEGKTKRAFTRLMGNVGQVFRDAARRLADGIGIEGEWRGRGTWEWGDAGECPLSGTAVETQLSTHHHNDCSAT